MLPATAHHPGLPAAPSRDRPHLGPPRTNLQFRPRGPQPSGVYVTHHAESSSPNSDRVSKPAAAVFQVLGTAGPCDPGPIGTQSSARIATTTIRPVAVTHQHDSSRTRMICPG